MAVSGIYKIINTKNNKYYIGSSIDVEKRWYQHKCKLKKGKHPNRYLQSAWDKHTESAFNFVFQSYPLDKKGLLQKEQEHLDTCDKCLVYNLTFNACGGGADVLKKEYYLLDLEGNILKTFLGGQDLCRYLNYKTQFNYNNINKDVIIKKKYRVLTSDFYKKNKKLLILWNKLYKDKNKKPPMKILYRLYKTFDKKEEILIYSKKQLKEILNTSSYKIEYLFTTFQYFETRMAYHKKSGYYINKENYIAPSYYLNKKLDF